MRLLFVDDEPRVLQGLRRLLFSRRAAWQMDFAEGGEEALELLEQRQHDVVISDVRMPRMSGMDLLEQVRQRQPGVVRIILSGQVDPGTALRAPEVAHRFLSKPCDAPELVAALEQVEPLCELPPPVRQLIAGVTSLPSVPAVRLRMEQLLGDPSATAEQVAAIVCCDVAMSAKVLHLVSSSFTGNPRPGADVAQAVTHLGLPSLREFFARPEVFGGTPAPGDGDGLRATEVSLRARARADAVAALPHPGNKPEAVTAALLAEIGQLVLAGRGADHRAVDPGAHLLALWGLPASLVQSMAGRPPHHPEHHTTCGPAPASHTLMEEAS